MPGVLITKCCEWSCNFFAENSCINAIHVSTKFIITNKGHLPSGCKKLLKSKITKILNSEENSKRKVSNQMVKSNDKHIKQIDNHCHIPDLVQAFSNVENSGLNLVLKCLTSSLYNTRIKFHYIYKDA